MKLKIIFLNKIKKKTNIKILKRK